MRGLFAVMAALVLICLVFGLAPADNTDDLVERSRSLFKPIPNKPPEIKGNPSNSDKVKLGHMLYFDPRLSASQLISCNTCHNLGLAGADLQETSVGHAWQKGARNAPTVFNAVFNIAQFWDGRVDTLAEQAKGPVQASLEMNNHPERAVATLKSMPQYVELFEKAFPGEKDPVTFDNLAKAIEVFEATLLTPHSPFDRYLLGDAGALSEPEKKGLQMFIVNKCAECHQGVNLGGHDYYPFGVKQVPFSKGGPIRPEDDTGRFKITFDPDDMFVFRSPSLRNVALTPPYFHSGKVWQLKEAVAIMSSAQLGITLDDEQVKLITAFLRTLTGEQPLVQHPVLPPNSEQTPRPSLEKPAPSAARSY